MAGSTPAATIAKIVLNRNGGPFQIPTFAALSISGSKPGLKGNQV